ncbi:MAG: DUF255 domain-containing protein, partial [Pseudomonadota bacterium]
LNLHGNDPVYWNDWSAGVLDQAKQSKRPIFVSIGYFSCHWCHVMQRESYQNPAIAKTLNKNFISVKVDRELHPDLDRILIDFVETTRGVAGWPLNVFLTPEGYPLTGFTYQPPENFHSLLNNLTREWQARGDELAKAAESYHLQRQQQLQASKMRSTDIPTERLIEGFVSQAMLIADELQGGFGNTSKFPNIPQLASLLVLIKHDLHLDQDVSDFVQLSLDAMASGNLKDHINHGFFRYVTDPDWNTPHFEKMLYTNAQLAKLYLEAHTLWPDRGYQQLGFEAIDFLERHLKHPDGGYMSSVSAVDRNDKEGGAYWWNQDELKRFLSDEEIQYLSSKAYFNRLESEFLPGPLSGPGSSGNSQTNQRILEKMTLRGTASMPVDDKRIASWNALVLDVLSLAATRDERFTSIAHSQYKNMRRLFFQGQNISRFANHPDSARSGLEDYVELANALFQYGKNLNQPEAIQLAQHLVKQSYQRYLLKGWWRVQPGGSAVLETSKWIIPDATFHSPMSIWVHLALSMPDLDPKLKAVAVEMTRRVTQDLVEAPYYYGSFILTRLVPEN